MKRLLFSALAAVGLAVGGLFVSAPSADAATWIFQFSSVQNTVTQFSIGGGTQSTSSTSTTTNCANGVCTTQTVTQNVSTP
ncbi:MAG TPA: hypothetical protein VFX15_10985 [Actinomycetes bacterium]|nr:hypothetical protein [Actinomycetes bacterium]